MTHRNDDRGGDTPKYNVAGQYSISSKLKQEVMQDLVRADTEQDVLKQAMNSKAIYNGESKYHRQRVGMTLHKDTIVKEEGHVVEHQKRKRTEMTEDTEPITYLVPETKQDIEQGLRQEFRLQEAPSAKDLRFLKPTDTKYFALALEDTSAKVLTSQEQDEKFLLLLLLRIKNGNTATRKLAMKSLSHKAKQFGPKLLFDKILPIMLDRSLEDQERHLMIKVIGRVLYLLGDEARPFTPNILVVTSPLLIDEDEVARATGREIISQLALTVGFAAFIKAIQRNLDNEDEYIRNLTSRAVAVASKALGVSLFVPFVNAVCHSRKSWRIRSTGAIMVQQMSVLLGIGVLPFLPGLVEGIVDGLTDEHIPIRRMTANTLASLAQSSYPYGIGEFNITLEPLWKGIRSHRGKTLAAFLRCMASLIPLMSPEYSGYYSAEVMKVIKREFNSPDDDMKKAVLLVLQKCSATDAITREYLSKEIIPEFFESFWTRRIALDHQLRKLVTYTTILFAEKLGAKSICELLLVPLKDDAELLRTMSVHAVSRVVKNLGTLEFDERLETRLVDALLISFQEQTNNDSAIIKGFGIVASSLGVRIKSYLVPIVSAILNNLKHKSPQIRENAAELCALMIPVIARCGEIQLLNKLGIILYESLGEIFPEVLGAIISSLKGIVDALDVGNIQPSLNQILPTLTPILRNKHRKVEVNTVNLVGQIALKEPECVPPKEWMRICFELLEMLKSTNKSIRRAANETFGYIARAIGPQDVLVALLDNLKVQERQLRVCTAVAIGIVAKTCGPYTVLPALMNEYRTPDTNVQNGVLKALAFMVEYIGDMSEDYVYFITPLIEDALTDRDLVHRQTAATIVRHIGLNSRARLNDDAFLHILNLLVPNIFETSPHVIVRILEGLESLSIVLGPGVFMNYIWSGLFHPAKVVRASFWKVYNTVYVNQADALVPHYPISDVKNLDIPELDLVL